MSRVCVLQYLLEINNENIKDVKHDDCMHAVDAYMCQCVNVAQAIFFFKCDY